MSARQAIKKKLKTFTLPIKTSFGTFLCQFEPSYPERGFAVTAPKVPGFVAYGETLSEAKRLAKSGLEFHCECAAREDFVASLAERRVVQKRTRVHV